MFEARLPGFLLSTLLHLGLFALVLFLPSFDGAPSPPQLTGPMILGPVTIGKEGRPTTSKQPQADRPQAGERQPRNVERQETRQDPQPKPVTRPTTDPVQPKPTATTKPPVDPNATALPKDPTKKQPQTNATAKADPSKNATKQPPHNATAKSDPTKNATPQKKGESLADALKGMEKTAGPTTSSTAPSRGAGRPGATRSALDDLRAEVGGGGTDATGDGPGGRGGDGVGMLGAYGESVVSRVRPNWTLPGQAKNYTAVVNVKINPDGSVRQAAIARSSGSSYIDSSVVQAVMASQLEPPPPGYSELEITFNTDELSR